MKREAASIALAHYAEDHNTAASLSEYIAKLEDDVRECNTDEAAREESLRLAGLD